MDKNIDITLKVWRQKGPKEKGFFETYPLKGISQGSSFLEMLDILNEQLINEGKDPVVFDHDCREGICGMCSLYINGRAHGPDTGITTCQLHMRHFKDGETIHIEPREVVIIEGILALCDKKLRNMMDLKIFVDADPDERLIRVIQRDVIERGCTAEAVMERYTRVLKPMHLQFIEPCKRYADLIVPEGGSNRVAIDILTMYIKKHLKN